MAAYRSLCNVFGTNPTSTQLNLLLISSRNNWGCYQPCATLKTRVIERKLGIPPRPKRPLSPFIRYCLSERENCIQNNPNTPMKNVTKLLAESWKTVSTEQKEELRNNYVGELEKYARDVMVYEQNLTDEQKQQMKNERIRVHQVDEKNKMKSRLKELGRPKRPATAFIVYMQSKMNQKDKSTKFPDWLSEIAKEWSNLGHDEKIKYEDESKKLMEQYKAEMIEWEEKMIKMGHIDVVRRQVLMDLKGKDLKSIK